MWNTVDSHSLRLVPGFAGKKERGAQPQTSGLGIGFLAHDQTAKEGAGWRHGKVLIQGSLGQTRKSQWIVEYADLE